MTKQTPQNRTGQKWFSIDGPYVWLAYLPLFFIPWFMSPPTTPQIIGGGVGLVVFLALYFAAVQAAGLRLISYAVATLVLAFMLAFTQSNWTVIAIYAAAMIGELRPTRHAGIFVVSFAIATLAVGLFLQQHPFYWAFGAFLMVMVGAANISRAALEDKNRALATAQDEVKQMAATAERERIGRDLHDLLGRTLTLIAIKAELAAKLSANAPTRAETEMREVAAAAREALAEVRAAVAGMTGATLGREIASAQSALAAAGIACIVEGDAEEIEQGAGAVLAMTLREAITNVLRHSGASTCRITLTQGAGGLELTVQDDGNGEAVREGGGISGVRSRVLAAGGGLRISGGASGTELVARLPTEASA
jgi:two-component system, NarL family, sensor histidine kinase DesK